ncbi:MAG: hypothetical protein O7A08_13100 [SAR324 cluster bacterium]|nr:hypothetical protein [SAR324 cluster bacterium]
MGPLKMTGDIVEDPIVLAGGSVPVPTAPGLGATLDEAALARFAFAV